MTFEIGDKVLVSVPKSSIAMNGIEGVVESIVPWGYIVRLSGGGSLDIYLQNPYYVLELIERPSMTKFKIGDKARIQFNPDDTTLNSWWNGRTCTIQKVLGANSSYDYMVVEDENKSPCPVSGSELAPVDDDFPYTDADVETVTKARYPNASRLDRRDVSNTKVMMRRLHKAGVQLVLPSPRWIVHHYKYSNAHRSVVVDTENPCNKTEFTGTDCEARANEYQQLMNGQ